MRKKSITFISPMSTRLWLIGFLVFGVFWSLSACFFRSPASEKNGDFSATPTCEIGRNNDDGVVGHDVGYSVVLADGVRFWVFGDTWIGKIADGRREIEACLHSTGAIQRGSDICSPVEYLTDENGNVRQLIPNPKEAATDGTENWVLAAVAAEKRVYAYYQRIRKNDNPVYEMNFDVLGVGLASADAATLLFELENDGDLLFLASDHGFADALFYDGEYLFGLGCPVQKGMLERPCRLARVPIGRIADRDSYRYWDGKEWQIDISQAVTLVDSGSSEMTLTKYGSRYLLVYSPPFSCDVLMRQAPSLTGPWSRPLTIFRAEVESEKNAFCYGGKLQQVSADGKRLEITWNSNGPLNLHVNDPHLYWPHAVKIDIDDLLGQFQGKQ